MLRIFLLCVFMVAFCKTEARVAGSSHPACGPDAAPAVAAALGFTCEVFWDNFLTSNSIDVNNTGDPNACPASSDNSYGNIFRHTCNWFTTAAWPGSVDGGAALPTTPTPLGDYSIRAGGGLVLSPAVNIAGGLINSCAYSSRPPGYQGWGPTGGYYIDIARSWTGSTGGPESSSGWTFPVSMYTGTATGKTFTFTEVDFYESLYGANIHDWAVPAFSQHTAQFNGADNNLTQGFAVIPGSPNTMQYYENDVAFSGATLNFGAGIAPSTPAGPLGQPVGTYSDVLAQINCIIFSAGVGQPHTITKVQVWQKP